MVGGGKGESTKAEETAFAKGLSEERKEMQEIEGTD